MKIAIFTDTYLPDRNGVSASVDHFTKLMADDGHQIMIFCPKNGRHKDKQYPGIEIRRYLSITAPSYKDMKLALPFVWTAIHDLKEFNPDVVHIQTPLGIGWIGVWATKIMKIPNIQTYHTYIPDFLVYVNPRTILGINKITEFMNSTRLKITKSITDNGDDEDTESLFRQYINQFLKDKDEDIKAEVIKSPSKFSERFGRDYTRLIYNRADLVLTPSLAMKKVLKKQGITSPIEVLSNGIDFEFFKSKTDYTIKNRILYIGRLGYEKSVDHVIKSFVIAAKKNKDIKLEIYGGGPAKLSLETLVKELGMQDRIIFHGFYDINKLSKHLHEFDFFMTASAIETQGIVILEAMASGLPVLGVDKLAVPEVVLDGQNGYISKFGDHEAMAANILKLVESKERLAEFGLKSLEMAKSHEVTECKDRLVKIYESIANQ